MIDYFFSGNRYTRVSRAQTGPGSVDAGYPAPISNWDWGAFGANGIDAALYSGSKCYFFSSKQYIRVTRGVTGPGTVDAGYPAPISNWNWGAFGANGIDAALNSGSVCYFFSGKEYIRVTRGETGSGVVDAGYPKPISNWNWGAFGANGIDAALYSGSKCYFFSGAQYVRVSRSDEGPGLLDAGYPAPISNWGWGSFGAKGIKGALYSGGPFAAAPSDGLGSNSNYFLYSPGASGACNHLTGVSVTIDVDVDITGSDGFGFQLNANSPDGFACEAQQYIIALNPNVSPQLTGWVNNWQSTSKFLINKQVELATLSAHTMPAGYRLTISLQNDSTGNITGAVFTVADRTGTVVGNQTISLSSFGAADLAPIVSFQLDFVDWANGNTTKLSSGAGTLTYAASNLLTVASKAPKCAELDFSTVEQANSVYGALPAASSQTFTQSFQASVTGGAIIQRKSGLAHAFRPRP